VTALAAIILGAFLLGHGSLFHLTEGGAVQGGGLARAVARSSGPTTAGLASA